MKGPAVSMTRAGPVCFYLETCELHSCLQVFRDKFVGNSQFRCHRIEHESRHNVAPSYRRTKFFSALDHPRKENFSEFLCAGSITHLAPKADRRIPETTEVSTGRWKLVEWKIENLGVLADLCVAVSSWPKCRIPRVNSTHELQQTFRIRVLPLPERSFKCNVVVEPSCHPFLFV